MRLWTRKGRRRQFKYPDDARTVEGLVWIEDFVQRHPVGKVFEQDLDRNTRVPEHAATVHHFGKGGDEIVQRRGLIGVLSLGAPLSLGRDSRSRHKFKVRAANDGGA